MAEEIVDEIGFSKDEATQLFNEFLAFLPQTIVELETALEKSEFEELKRIAHKLKGASANLRVVEISKLGAQLENESLNQDKEFCGNVIEQIKGHLKILLG